MAKPKSNKDSRYKHVRYYYPDHPFIVGYSIPEDKFSLYAEKRLNEALGNQKWMFMPAPLGKSKVSLLEKFVGQPWEGNESDTDYMSEFYAVAYSSKEDLIDDKNKKWRFLGLLKSKLRRCCNIQNPDPLTWEEIFAAINDYLSVEQEDTGADVAGRQQENDVSNQNLAALRDILAAIEEWKIVADKNGLESKDAKQLGSKAVKLLFQHIKLLDDFQLRFGASVITQETLSYLTGKVNSVNPAARQFSNFYDHENFCQENFIADLKRWIKEASEQKKEETPQTPPVREEWPKPIDTTGRWNCKNLNLLRDIDSNVKRDGIPGDKKKLSRLKEYLKRRRKREDVAETLYLENERIKTKMPHRSMFKEK